MSKDPAILFYYKDFDSDTADWEADAVGWYMRLLIFQSGNGYVPSGIEDLAQVARVRFSDYQTFCERWAKRLACKFETLSEGKLTIKKEFVKILKDSGFNHPSYKGVYDTNRKIRQSPQYRRFKINVLDRDKKTCKKCGSKNNLHVHHIKPFSTHSILRFVENNGITLCQSCHIKIHKND